jgi:hypothetical protein
VARITHEKKPLREPLSIMWDGRRVLPRYARDFCAMLATHMRTLGSGSPRSSSFRR